MRKTFTLLLIALTLNVSAQRVEAPAYEINLHLDMADKMQTASGVIMVTSLAVFTGGLLFADGNTQKGLYLLSADCFLFAGVCQLSSGYHNRKARRLKYENRQ